MEFLPSFLSLYIICFFIRNILFFALLLLHNRFKVPWVATDGHYSLHSKLKCSFHCHQSVVRLSVSFFPVKREGKAWIVLMYAQQGGWHEEIFERGGR
jgi:hypothetical protein